MILNFKSIDIKNFLSIGEAHIDLSDQGLVQVRGVNKSPISSDSNGAGKSSIFEAIYYALTGETLRGTKEVANRFTGEKCVDLVLEFEMDGINYKIERCRSHPKHGNNLKIWKNGEDISGDKLKKSEAVLAQELGLIDSSLINGIIILGQSMPNRFTSLTPIQRKDRLEVLSQSSEFINDLDARLKSYEKFYTAKMNDSRVEKGKKEMEISMSQERLQKLSQELVSISEQEVDMEALEDERKDLEAEVTEIEKNITVYSDAHQKISKAIEEYNSSYTACNSKIYALDAEINRLRGDLSRVYDVCPTCGQAIDPNKVASLRKSIQDQIDIAENSKNILMPKLTQYQDEITSLQGRLQKCNEAVATVQAGILMKRTRIAQIDMESKVMQANIDRINSDIADLNDRISKAGIELDAIEKEEKQFELKLGITDFLKKQASREFRGYLLKGVVEYVNGKLQSYSQSLFGTGNIEMAMDANCSKIIITYDGSPYENLSGGERQRVDIAVQFSLRDMLMSSLGFSCNLLVLDEVFDGLDKSGINDLIGVINGLRTIDSVFAISHHNIVLPFDHELTVVKGIDYVSSVETMAS